MDEKKRVIILVSIAAILAITAIALNMIDSEEVPASMDLSESSPGSGQIGIEIQPAPVEDKLKENQGEINQ